MDVKEDIVKGYIESGDCGYERERGMVVTIFGDLWSPWIGKVLRKKDGKRKCNKRR